MKCGVTQRHHRDHEDTAVRGLLKRGLLLCTETTENDGFINVLRSQQAASPAPMEWLGWPLHSRPPDLTRGHSASPAPSEGDGRWPDPLPRSQQDTTPGLVPNILRDCPLQQLH